MRAVTALLMALLAVIPAAAAADDTTTTTTTSTTTTTTTTSSTPAVTGTPVAPFEIQVSVQQGATLDTSQYAAIATDDGLYLVMVQQDDLNSTSDTWQYQPMIVVIPSDSGLYSVSNGVVTFNQTATYTAPAYCLDPTAEHPTGTMVVPTWDQLQSKQVEVPIVTNTGQTETVKITLTQDVIKNIVEKLGKDMCGCCKETEEKQCPCVSDQWKESQLLVWATLVAEAVKTTNMGLKINMAATLQTMAQDKANGVKEAATQLQSVNQTLANTFQQYSTDVQSLATSVNTYISTVTTYLQQNYPTVYQLLETIASNPTVQSATNTIIQTPVNPLLILLALPLTLLLGRRF